MSTLIEELEQKLNLQRYIKKIIAIIVDLGLCVLCTWLALYFRYSLTEAGLKQYAEINEATIIAMLISMMLSILIFWFSGLYKTMYHFRNSSIVLTIVISIFTYGILYFMVISIYGIKGVPRSIGIIQPALMFVGITSSRLFINYLYIFNFTFGNPKNKKNVLIYGAGSAGRQLLISLENNLEMKVVGFLDDNKRFHNQLISGQTVYDPSRIEKLNSKKEINLILLAIPSISRIKRNKIIDSLNKYKLMVKTLPSIQDIVDGKVSVSDIKDLTVEDLLSREQVTPNVVLLSKNMYSKVVLVTGAGGSIGSELCRQIIKLKPKKLLLLELNEFALYKISEELKNQSKNFKVIPLLINVQNSSRVDEVFKTFKVDTVYHAAAYKHVPLVEENICESVKNNVFGTLLIAQISIKYNVANFVFISSDKAVRPTNIMGASKRLSEICIQALYNSQNKNSKFAIVRFGNVLQSSGSVIPKFTKQIKEGGPVTLTDTMVTRYFMTIIEASQLVIQAGAMSEGCEVFILDMGESVKIKNLIDKMIKLSGLTIKDHKNLDGDIEIKITGLRPGEKLYEELLIGDNPQKTYHEKIQKAQDPFIPYDQLKIDLDNLSTLIEDNRVVDVKDMLGRLVSSYQSNSEIVDHIYEEKLNFKNNVKIGHKGQDQEKKVIKFKTK